MSWFFYPYLRRYWLDETEEKLTTVIFLRKKLMKDIVQKIMEYLTVDDDPDPLNWLRIWYRNPNVHQINPLICFESKQNYGTICIFGLIVRDSLFYEENKERDKEKEEEKEKNIKWLSNEICDKKFDRNRIHLAQMYKLKLTSYDTNFKFNSMIIYGDIFLGIIIPDDNKIENFRVKIFEFELPFDNYIEINVRVLDDSVIDDIKLLKIEKRKMWFSKINPIASTYISEPIICSTEQTEINVVYGFNEPDVRNKYLYQFYTTSDYRNYINELLK